MKEAPSVGQAENPGPLTASPPLDNKDSKPGGESRADQRDLQGSTQSQAQLFCPWGEASDKKRTLKLSKGTDFVYREFKPKAGV